MAIQQALAGDNVSIRSDSSSSSAPSAAQPSISHAARSRSPIDEATWKRMTLEREKDWNSARDLTQAIQTAKRVLQHFRDKDGKRAGTFSPYTIHAKGYDILKRKLPSDFMAETIAQVNRHVHDCTPGCNEGPAPAQFSMDHYIAFIDQIASLPSDRHASRDPQMLAIALARKIFTDAPTGNWTAAELNCIGEAFVRAIKSGPYGPRINPLDASHSMNFTREAGRRMEHVTWWGGPGAEAVATALFPLSWLAVSGLTLALDRKQDKPQNKLMKAAMEVMERLAANGDPMSKQFRDACHVVADDSSLGDGDRVTEFRDELARWDKAQG